MNPSDSDIQTRLKSVICETFNLSPDEYSTDLQVGDVPQWDSLGHIRLLSAVESTFNIAFDVTDAVDMESISDIQTKVKSYLGN